MAIEVFVQLLTIVVKAIDVQFAFWTAYGVTCACGAYVCFNRHCFRNGLSALERTVIVLVLVFNAIGGIVIFSLDIRKCCSAAIFSVLTVEFRIVE